MSVEFDLSAAHKLARGSRQKQWLAELLDEAGLHPGAWSKGRYGGHTYGRLMDFVERLEIAGYTIARRRPAPPNRAERLHLASHSRWAARVGEVLASAGLAHRMLDDLHHTLRDYDEEQLLIAANVAAALAGNPGLTPDLIAHATAALIA